MPTDIAIKSIPGQINIPETDLSAFKNTKQVIWTGSQWRDKPQFTPSWGDAGEFLNDGGISTPGGSGNLYTSIDTDGFDITVTSGKRHWGIAATYGDGRWMPATIFNGCGFEVRQTLGKEHALYLVKWGPIFTHRTLNDTYRTFGIDTGASSPYNGYRYITFPTGEINTVRSWGKDWMLQGLVLNYTTEGGITAADTSSLRVFNVRFGHKMSNLNSAYRYIPAGPRYWGARDRVNVGFTDPFKP